MKVPGTDCRIPWYVINTQQILKLHVSSMIELWIKSREMSFGNQQLNQVHLVVWLSFKQSTEKDVREFNEQYLITYLSFRQVMPGCHVNKDRVTQRKGCKTRQPTYFLFCDLLNIVTSALTRPRKEAKKSISATKTDVTRLSKTALGTWLTGEPRRPSLSLFSLFF